MRLVQKLTLALILGISAVIAADAYFRVRREIALLQRDRVRDHELLGLAMSAAFSTVWRTAGELRAREMLDQASAREGELAVRWASAMPEGFPVSSSGVTSVVLVESGASTRRTYVPISGAGAPPGGLVISESLVGEQRYVERMWLDTIVTSAFLATVSAALCGAIGGWFIGRPVRALMDKARRVGHGDFSGPLELRQRDELGGLAREMNFMCDRLVEADARSHADEALRIAALDQLRHADRLMTVGKLASGIAHELGTPLNVVTARAGMIADGETDAAESVDYARVIVGACEQMTKIIRQLLDFARPRGPERTLEDVRRIAERTVALLEPLAAKKQLALAIDEPAEPVLAELDAGQIQQVLTNLVANAIQASSRGTVRVAVAREHARRDGQAAPIDCVALRVRDEGTGIPKEHLDHVFEPFFTTKEVGQGTGLGLSVAYGMVREHEGWMTVESAPGKGTEFAVLIPLRRTEEGST